MLQIMLSQKKNLKFSEELKSFATTLHYYSPVGYQYVRNTFLKCLPPVSTLSKPRQRWTRNNFQESRKSIHADNLFKLNIEVSGS